jgi:hypothetical protein
MMIAILKAEMATILSGSVNLSLGLPVVFSIGATGGFRCAATTG